MRKFRAIVETPTAPSTDCLWISEEVAKYFKNGKWTELCCTNNNPISPISSSSMQDRDYVKPNEPYTVMLNTTDIDVVLDDIKASQIIKAGEIIISGNTGPITYTRTADSTKSIIYFTDHRKDGKLTVLTYNVTNKIIKYSESFMATDKATKTKVGGIHLGNAIANATISDLSSVGNTLNSLLAELRKIGVLSNN